MKKVIEWAERGLVPDALIRVGIRRLLRHRIRAITPPTSEAAHSAKREFLHSMADSAVALHTEEANDQHYEALMILEQLADRADGGELAGVRAAQWRITHSFGHAWQWLRAAWSAIRAGTYSDRAAKAAQSKSA